MVVGVLRASLLRFEPFHKTMCPLHEPYGIRTTQLIWKIVQHFHYQEAGQELHMRLVKLRYKVKQKCF